MASTIQYNMERIREIIDECNWPLSEKVQSIFQELDKLIVVEDEDLNAIPLKRNDRSFDRFKNKKRFYKSSSKSGSLNNMNIEDWEAIRNFKPTEKEEVSDFNKSVNEILLNFSGKGFSQFKEVLSELIINEIGPITKEMKNLMNNKDEIVKILIDGSNKAKEIANEVLYDIKKIIGINFKD